MSFNGLGSSIGNCTDPFALWYRDHSSLKASIPDGRWVEAYVVLERRKVDQVPVHHECWNFILDRFLCVGRGFLDGSSYLFQDLVHIARKAGDVLVNAVGLIY